MAEMALLKAVEAGVDGIDTAISSMSGTYGHPATESLVATLQGTEYDTGLDIPRLEKIAAYFRNVRKKYAKFEGQLRGVDRPYFSGTSARWYAHQLGKPIKTTKCVR